MKMIFAGTLFELRNVKPYLKSALMMVLLMGPAFALALKANDFLIMYIFLAMFNLSLYPFTLSEKNHTDVLFGTLPISPKQTVLSRYLYVAIVILAGSLLAVIESAVVTMALGRTFNLTQTLSSICLFTIGASVMVGLQYPVYFALGYEKAKMWSYVPLLLIAAAIMLTASNTSTVDVNRLLATSPLISSLLALAILAISCIISTSLYKPQK